MPLEHKPLPFPSDALEPYIERFALEELHRHEGHAALFFDLVDADDVIVLDLGHRLGFAQEAFAGAGAGGEGRQHGLDGDGAFQLRVLGLAP